MEKKIIFFSAGSISVIFMKMMFVDRKDSMEVAITTISLILLTAIFIFLYKFIKKMGKSS
jgi:ABC-type enterobactin transport system permease subunit